MTAPAIFLVLAFFCLVSALITYGLGVFVLSRNSTSILARLFAAAMISATYWGLGEFLIWNSGGYEGVWFWLKASSLWPFTIAFTLHFVLTYTGHPLSRPERTKLLVLLLYIPAAIFSLVGVFSDLLYTVIYQEELGYVYRAATGNPAYHAMAIYILLVMLCAAYVSYSTWRVTARGKLRRQNRLISAGIATVILFGSLSGLVFPVFAIYTPNLVFIGIAIFSLIITYAVLQHGLFTLTPETAVPDLIRAMPDGMILADKEGRIITANASAARIFGVEESELPGRVVGTLLPSKAYESIRAAMGEQGILSEFETVLDRKDPVVVSMAGSLVRDPAGDPAGIVLIVRDVTGRKASEEALRIANEKISLLASMTRHDVSNLVTALYGYLDLLREDISGKEDAAYLSKCVELVGKIDSYLRFSREYQEIGSQQPIWRLLSEMISQAANDVPHEGIDITARINPVEVYSDPLAVKVFYNLLDNAVRHGGHLTRIGISTEKAPDGDLVVVFEDNGGGVGFEEKERIFGYGVGKNTGFGLTISREVLALTGSSIVETGIPGKGARFEVRFPPKAWRYRG
jgi:PAS domain S-box-containing protein